MITLPTATWVTGNLLLKPVSFGPLLNSEDSFQWLMSRTELLGWTYTFQLGMCWKFTRLIVGRPLNEPQLNIRHAPNCHIKCYISDDTALLGSFNLTMPTIEDYSILITDKKQLKHLRKLHKEHWFALA